jgi:hypothetical protein
MSFLNPPVWIPRVFSTLALPLTRSSTLVGLPCSSRVSAVTRDRSHDIVPGTVRVTTQSHQGVDSNERRQDHNPTSILRVIQTVRDRKWAKTAIKRDGRTILMTQTNHWTSFLWLSFGPQVSF